MIPNEKMYQGSFMYDILVLTNPYIFVFLVMVTLSAGTGLTISSHVDDSNHYFHQGSIQKCCE